MAWEQRKGGPHPGYYYRSVRTIAGIKKVYYGRGIAGHDAAAEVERRRQGRLEAKQLIQTDRECTDEADRLAAELREWAAVLSAAWMILTGHYHRRSEWRRKPDGE